MTPEKEIRIGVYDQDKNLIGYKADTFWTLSKTSYKVHHLENGEVSPHYVKNLLYVLKPKQKDSSNLVDIISSFTRKAFENISGLYVGYEEMENGQPVSDVKYLQYINNDLQMENIKENENS